MISYNEVARLMTNTREILAISVIPSGLTPWVCVRACDSAAIGDRLLVASGSSMSDEWIALCRDCDRSALTCIFDPCAEASNARR